MATRNGNGKSPTKSPPRGELITPRHGNGRIRRGSLPGNTPGTGRPPSIIRERLRGSFEQRVKILESIADDEEAPPSERMKAIDILAKYGLGTTNTETDTEGNDAPRQIIIREYAE